MEGFYEGKCPFLFSEMEIDVKNTVIWYALDSKRKAIKGIGSINS